jgi:hypothetical protein
VRVPDIGIGKVAVVAPFELVEDFMGRWHVSKLMFDL